jgi:hypothetical protein
LSRRRHRGLLRTVRAVPRGRPARLAGILAMAAIAMAAAEGPVPSPAVYRIAQPRGWVYLERAAARTRIRAATPARGGDGVRTAWFSSAEIEVPARGARFLLGPRTDARLAAGPPGVLLDVRRGRLRAIFDKLVGDDSVRLVTTPAAVVAVRGTRFGLAVSGAGDTRIVVFAGVLEVSALAGAGAPVSVPAGTFTTVPFDGVPEPPRPAWFEEETWVEATLVPLFDDAGRDLQEGPGAHDQRPGPEAPGGESNGHGSGSDGPGWLRRNP